MKENVIIFHLLSLFLLTNCQLFGIDSKGGCGIPPYDTWKPWNVAVYENTTMRCLGAIIKRNVVLTAAHCVADYADHTNINNETLYIKHLVWIEKLPIEKVYISPYFNNDTLVEDVALVHLKPHKYNYHPACVDFAQEITIEENSLIQSIYSGKDDQLTNFQQFPLNNDDCCYRAPPKFQALIGPDKKCLESVPRRFHQDEGGALLYVDGKTKMHYVVGIISRHEETQRQLTIYTPINFYLNWISNLMTQLN